MSAMKLEMGAEISYVSSDSVVPNNDRVRLPPDTGLVVNTPVYVVVEKVEDSICTGN